MDRCAANKTKLSSGTIRFRRCKGLRLIACPRSNGFYKWAAEGQNKFRYSCRSRIASRDPITSKLRQRVKPRSQDRLEVLQAKLSVCHRKVNKMKRPRAAQQLFLSLAAPSVADFTILSQDIMKIPEGEVLKTRCEMTIIGGEVVFESGE